MFNITKELEKCKSQEFRIQYSIIIYTVVSSGCVMLVTVSGSHFSLEIKLTDSTKCKYIYLMSIISYVVSTQGRCLLMCLMKHMQEYLLQPNF